VKEVIITIIVFVALLRHDVKTPPLNTLNVNYMITRLLWMGREVLWARKEQDRNQSVTGWGAPMD
jgi:hypothetical protein